LKRFLILDSSGVEGGKKMDTAAMVLAPLVDVGDRIDRYTIRRVIHGARDIVVCEVRF
jgi:tRNA-dihydrouridine synthase